MTDKCLKQASTCFLEDPHHTSSSQCPSFFPHAPPAVTILPHHEINIKAINCLFLRVFLFLGGGGKLTAIFSTHTHKKNHHTLSHCIQVTGVYYELFARLNLSHLAPCFHQHCCLCEPQWHRRAWRQTLSVWTLSQPSRCDSSRFLCKYQHVSVLPFNMSGVFLDPPLCSKINIKQCICIFPDNYFKVFWKEYSKKVL